MKKQKPQNNINLEKLAGGAFAEKLNEALMQVAENIQNQNTEATAKRGITVNIKFTPNKSRQMVSASISVTTKLAAAEAIDTQIIMGKNLKTGKIEFAEYDGQIPGQLSIADLEQEEPEPDDTIAQLAASGLIAGKDFDPETGEVYKNTIEDNTTERVVPIRKFI